MESTPVLSSARVPFQPQGLSLVELIVVMAIISVITTIAILGQNTFNRSLILMDTMYSVAFSGRQAQSFGLSSRKFGALTSNPGYGLHFDRATLNRYMLFADTVNTATPFPTGCPVGVAGTPSAKPGNCRFDTADGIVNTYTFGRGFTVQKFCGKVGVTQVCSTDLIPLTTLDLVFTRPNTSTIISGLVAGAPTTFGCAVVTLTDQKGEGTRDMRVSSLGEISVGTNLACP